MKELVTEKNKILFLCTGNSCRSQIAEALAQYEFDDNFYFYSAGVEAHGMNPYTIKTLNELGIDVSDNISKVINNEKINTFDLVITLCGDARDKCPILESSVNHTHWDIKDPANFKGNEQETLSEYSRIRNIIHAKIINLKTKFSNNYDK